MKNKKGQLGLPVVKAVFIAMLILALVAVSTFLVLPALRDSVETIDLADGTNPNESLTAVTEVTQDFAVNSERNPACAVDYCANATDDIVIPASNYTVTNCQIAYSAPMALGFNGTNWECTYTFQYSNPQSNDITNNITIATGDFFSNTSTIYAILIAVVIILAVSLIIVVVNRFGGAAVQTGL